MKIICRTAALLLFLSLLGHASAADRLKVTRSVRLYEQPTSLSQKIRTLAVGELLTQASPGDTNDYVEVDTDQAEHGWVYKFRVTTVGQNNPGGGGGSPSAPRPIHGLSTRAFSELAPISGDEMRVHFIDIGQGASTLLEFPCGAALIDTGGEMVAGSYDSVPALRAYLDAFFQSRADLNGSLDLLALTHPHIDHTRGAAMVLDNFGVKNIIDNGQRRNDSGGTPQIKVEDWAQQHVNLVSYEGIRASDVPAAGLTNDIIDPFHSCARSTIDPQILVLWGQMDPGANGASNPNNNSLAIRVKFNQFSLLVDGDLEMEGIAGLLGKFATHPDLLNVDVWEVGHHGSRNATTADLVTALSPALAVFCCGPFERQAGTFIAREFAHPNDVSVTALEAEVTSKRTPVAEHIGVSGAHTDQQGQHIPAVFKTKIINTGLFATGWDGNIVLTAKADGTFSVWTEKDATNVGLTGGH